MYIYIYIYISSVCVCVCVCESQWKVLLTCEKPLFSFCKNWKNNGLSQNQVSWLQFISFSIVSYTLSSISWILSCPSYCKMTASDDGEKESIQVLQSSSHMKQGNIRCLLIKAWKCVTGLWVFSEVYNFFNLMWDVL